MSTTSIQNSYFNQYGMGRMGAESRQRNTVSTDTDTTKDHKTGSVTSDKPNNDATVSPPKKPWDGEIGFDGVNSVVSSGAFNPSMTYLMQLSTTAAKDLGKSSVTFKDLLAHRDYLTEQFSTTIRKGLGEAGVSGDADFRISLTTEGAIEIKSNHADKAKIEKYFKENPELAKDYQHIESLNQLENTRQTQSYDINGAFNQGRLLSMSSLLMKQPPTNMAVTGAGSAVNLLGGGLSAMV